MIVILKPEIREEAPEVARLLKAVEAYEGVHAKIHTERGEERSLLEVHLIGRTEAIPRESIEELPGVQQVVRVSDRYRLIGRHKGQVQAAGGFEYRGVRFDQESLHVFAGLCAVDTRENAESMFAACRRAGLVTSRMGAYKPRTSPYDFQGLGSECLPFVFELAGKYGIEVIAMEVTLGRQVGEIRDALEAAGNPTGVMLQVGTRNAQNFELLREIGQAEFPVLYKRGMGITLEEAFNACEYVASEGNRRIVFCLRGVKSNLGDPHRNFVDVGQIPVVKRNTRLPVCFDPSHSVGRKEPAPDGLNDIEHVTAQAVVAGANMILVDFHPNPEEALCDGPQALLVTEMDRYLEGVRIAREAYERRVALAKSST